MVHIQKVKALKLHGPTKYGPLESSTNAISHSSILKYQESTSANVPGISTYEQQVALENIPLDRWRLATVQKTLRVLSDGAQIMQPNSLTEVRSVLSS